MTQQQSKRTTVKGTVLYTVISVMMVLIVFLLGTLALAATANKRAQYNYSSAQTQSTAKAAVDAILTAMQNSENIATSIAALDSEGDSITLSEGDISFTDSSYGTFTGGSIEYAGKQYYYDNDETSTTYQQMVGQEVIKITATVAQGTAESTVSCYILKGEAVTSTTPISNGGAAFLTTGGLSEGQNHLATFGGSYLGYETPTSATYYDTATGECVIPLTDADFSTQNDGVVETDLCVNGNLKLTNKTVLVVKGLGTGLTVWGDLTLDNSGSLTVTSVNATLSSLASSTVSYKDIPYIYVDGLFNTNGNSINASSSGSSTVPLNIFCGSITMSSDQYIGADIYCYDETATSTIAAQNSSQLYSWTLANVTRADGTSGSYTAGNFYSKGNVEISGNSKITFSGDVCVEGNVTVQKNTVIYGDLMVGGTLTVSSGTLTVYGTIYCDSVVGYSGDVEPLTPGSKQLKDGYSSKPCTAELFYTVGDIDLGSVYFQFYYLNGDDKVPVYALYNNNETFYGPNLVKDSMAYNAETFTFTYKWSWSKSNETITILEENLKYTLYYNSDGEIVTEEEATIYVDENGNISEPLTIFPEEYEKAVILGFIDTDGDEQYLSDGSLNSDYDNQMIVQTVQYFYDNVYNPYSTITSIPDGYETEVNTHVTNMSNVLTAYNNSSSYDDGAVKLTKMKLSELFSDTSSVISYYSAGWTADTEIDVVVIYGSCTIYGTMPRIPVIMQPRSGDIWVQIGYEGNTLSVSSGGGNTLQGCLWLDDKNTSNAAYLLLTNELTCNTDWNNLTIGTTSMFEKLCSTGTYQIYTSESYALDTTTYPVISAPKLYLYSTKSGASLSLANLRMITAMVYAPYMDLTMQDTWAFKATIYYNGYQAYPNSTVSDQRIGCIGCLIVKNCTTTNPWALLYTDDASNAGANNNSQTLTDSNMEIWTKLYYTY